MFERSALLIGNDEVKSLFNCKVAVIGLGGVGGTAAECLLRSGVRSLKIIDCDKVDVTNLNRQILYTSKDVGKRKTDVAAKRLKTINKKTDIEKVFARISPEFFEEFHLKDCDYVVDAIDDVEGKLALAKHCTENGIPLIMSLGMANRLDPTKIAVMPLSKTENDPLAKKIRSVFRKNGLSLASIKVVCSTELPVKKGMVPSSMMMVPSAAGLTMASVVINTLKDKYR